MGTNKAEEYADNKYTKQAKEYAITSSIRAIYENCIIDFKEGYNSRQSEIDELTKEKSLFIEKYTKSCDEVQKLEKVNDELTKEVERMKGSVRTLCIQHQQLLDKAIDEKITDEETDGYKQSLEILDEIRNLIN